MDKLLGIRIDKYSKNQLLQLVKEAVVEGKKLHIVTLNTELLIASKSNKKLKEIINNSSIVIPESSGLYLADNYLTSNAKPSLIRLVSSGVKTILGTRGSLPERTTGVDLGYSIASLSEKFGYKLLLLGGQNEAAKVAAEGLKNLFPKLKVKGIYGGRFGLDDRKIFEQVQRYNPDVIFVGFGVPKQEYWIAENLDKISAKVAIGVGGTLDFMAGKVPRAPKMVRNLGLEWAFRLAVQPWRIKRQLALIKFIKVLLRS